MIHFLRRIRSFTTGQNDCRREPGGDAEGKAEGELYSLLSLIRKKVQKGKSLAQTAEELEDTEENLRLFYETVRKNPEDTVEQLAERLMKKEEII